MTKFCHPILSKRQKIITQAARKSQLENQAFILVVFKHNPQNLKKQRVDPFEKHEKSQFQASSNPRTESKGRREREQEKSWVQALSNPRTESKGRRERGEEQLGEHHRHCTCTELTYFKLII